MAKIWAVCKDSGGTQNLLPVLPLLLRNNGHEVRLILHEGGHGQAVLETCGEQYEEVADAKAFLKENNNSDLLITTMCSGGGVGRDLVELVEVPVVALQDFWGARLATDFANGRYRPDIICVNDQFGADIVRSVWKDAEGVRVVVTGYPRFDTLAGLDVGAAGRRGRELLSITDDRPVVFYPGQVWHAGETLLKLVTELNNYPHCHLVATRHGRMMEELHEVEHWEKARETFLGEWHEVTDFSHITDVIAAANLVVGQYSTLQVDAAVLGRPIISVLESNAGAERFRMETGGVVNEFPLVTLGCSTKAESIEELKKLVAMALEGGLHLEEKQREVFRLDGKNAERAVEAIFSLL